MSTPASWKFSSSEYPTPGHTKSSSHFGMVCISHWAQHLETLRLGQLLVIIGPRHILLFAT
ncbi:hypothetical protein B0H14DRAFT_3445940 [Mycena olivaceomarginata]|nr:hypothetical protein B0H14DRAFT_3445940 [Mycena olivaceomarginata]